MASPDDVEAQFYDALREGDVDKLMALWADDDEVVCVPPGGARVIGVRAIRAAFEAAFAGGGLPLRAEQVRRLQTIDAAVHTVVENVTIASAEGSRTGYVIATNVYLRGVHGWRMVAHHASPGLPDAPQDAQTPPSMLH